MPVYDSAYLRGAFDRLAGRPQADALLPEIKYQWLSEAMHELVGQIAAICPNVLYPTVSYSSMPTLTTTDNQVFTFGTDGNGYAIAPMGKTGIYASLNDIPTNPWVEHRDYMNEGTQIRIPNNRTYSGTLYWRGITPPSELTAANAPSLFPEASRMLIPHIACLNFAVAAGRNPALAEEMRGYLGHPWSKDDRPGAFARWCLTWRTNFRSGGVLGLNITGRDLALVGQ